MNFDGSTLISHLPTNYTSTNSNNGNKNTLPTVQLSFSEQSLTLGMSFPGQYHPDLMAFKSLPNQYSAVTSLSSSLPISNPNFDRPPISQKSRSRPQNQKRVYANQHFNVSSPSLMGGSYGQSSATSIQASYSQVPYGLQHSAEFSQDGQRHTSFHNDAAHLFEDTKPTIFTQDDSNQQPQHPVFAHTVSEDMSFTPDVSHATIFSQASQDVSPYGDGTNSSFQQGTAHQTAIQYLQHPREHKRRSSPAALENSYKLQYAPTDAHPVMTSSEQNMSAEDLTGIKQVEAALLLTNFNRPPDYLDRKEMYASHRMSWDCDASSSAHPLQAQPMRHAASMHANPPYNNSIHPPLHSHSKLHTNGIYPNQADRRHSFDVSVNWKQGARQTPQAQFDIKPIFDGFDNALAGATITSAAYEPNLSSATEISSLPSVMEPSSGPQYRSMVDLNGPSESPTTPNTGGRRLTWTQSSGSVPGVHDGANSTGMLDSALYAQQPFTRDPYTSNRYSLPLSAPVSARPTMTHTSTQQKRKSALLDESIINGMLDEDYLTVGPSPSLQGAQAQPPSPTDPLFRKRTKSLDMSTEGYCDEADMGDLSMDDGTVDMNSDCPAFPEMSTEELEAVNNDPEAKPRRQRLRYVGDKYTPQWVRYQGQMKEGYCDLCRPGKWLQLKNSAYWYHKQFYHGISSVSGKEFEPPQDQRWADSELFEGLCHQCQSWVPVQNSKRKNSVLWYRHAHKCHVYHKPRAQQNHISKKR